MGSRWWHVESEQCVLLSRLSECYVLQAVGTPWFMLSRSDLRVIGTLASLLRSLGATDAPPKTIAATVCLLVTGAFPLASIVALPTRAHLLIVLVARVLMLTDN